jgi:ribosome biogenesis protein Nip4
MQTQKTEHPTMKAKAITDFAAQFGVQIALNPDLIVEKNGRYYLVNNALKPFVKPDFFYAGAFLGKAKEGKFFPSFNLLSMLAKQDASRVVVDRKAAWLFICGRDILAPSVVRIHGSGKKNTNTLVLNEFSECLGFGRIVGKLSGEAQNQEIAVRNVSDVGDFLRRERY